jgi:hypothetical protein
VAGMCSIGWEAWRQLLAWEEEMLEECHNSLHSSFCRYSPQIRGSGSPIL